MLHSRKGFQHKMILILLLFCLKINSNFLFRTHVVRLYDLKPYDYRSHVVRLYSPMSYDYRVPCRTTWELINITLQSQKIITLWFSASSFPRSYFQYSQSNKNQLKIQKSQEGKCKKKITNTHGSIYIVRSCCSSKWRLCICFLNSHCVAFLSLHIIVSFIKVWQCAIHFYTTTHKPNQTFWLFQ